VHKLCLPNFAASATSLRHQFPMRTIEKWKAFTFIVSLAFIAMVIHAIQPLRLVKLEEQLAPQKEWRPGPPFPLVSSTNAQKPPATTRDAQAPKEEETTAERERRVALAAKREAEERAAEHERYLQRYVNQSPTRQAGTKMLAVVATEDERLSRLFTTAIAEHLQSPRLTVSTSLVTAAFVSDGLFTRAFAGSREELTGLEVPKLVDAVLLARQSTHYSVNPPSLENVITATMRLEVVMPPFSGEQDIPSWTFTAQGAGFKEKDARLMAQERLLKQIAADTNLVPASILANIP